MDRTAEEERFLKHHTDIGSVRGLCEVSDITVIDPDTSVIDIIEAQEGEK